MIGVLKRAALVFSVSLVLTLPQLAMAKDDVVILEKPSPLAMTADFFIARPVLLGVTIIGTAIFIVSSPFSLAGGNFKEAGENLVVGPAKSTFVRCLGCIHPGYKKEVREIKGSE